MGLEALSSGRWEKKKTDNASQAAKIALRLHFLKKYHSENAKVFDCCQGVGLVWAGVRREFTVKTYFGVDLKPQKGRIAIDSVRLLQQGVNANVIDVDTYGEPWAHWLALVKHIKEPTTVFLTVGSINPLAVSNVVKNHVFGNTIEMPPTLFAKLWDYAIQKMLSAPYDHGCDVVECMEAVSKNKTRYLGLHIKPKTEE